MKAVSYDEKFRTERPEKVIRKPMTVVEKNQETTIYPKPLNIVKDDIPEVTRRRNIGTKLFIKNMVSIPCKMIVKSELDKLGLHYIVVNLGEVDIMEDITIEQRAQLQTALLKFGLELMDNKKAILVEKIKNVAIEMVHYADEMPKVKHSVYFADKLHYDYTYLSNLFSEVAGTSLEHYIIAHKIERVKELLLYNELTLTKIAYKLNYSSVAYLSAQFRKVTGLTPSFFKNLKHKKLLPLENVGTSYPQATNIAGRTV